MEGGWWQKQVFSINHVVGVDALASQSPQVSKDTLKGTFQGLSSSLPGDQSGSWAFFFLECAAHPPPTTTTSPLD